MHHLHSLAYSCLDKCHESPQPRTGVQSAKSHDLGGRRNGLRTQSPQLTEHPGQLALPLVDSNLLFIKIRIGAKQYRKTLLFKCHCSHSLASDWDWFQDPHGYLTPGMLKSHIKQCVQSALCIQGFHICRFDLRLVESADSKPWDTKSQLYLNPGSQRGNGKQ